MPLLLIHRSKLLVAILWFFTSSAFGQFGAPTEASGNASSTSTTIWSSWHNPAGITSMTSLSGAVGHRIIQGLEGLSTTGLALSYPVKFGAFGLGVSRFGDNLFNQQQIHMSYGSRFGITDLGIRVSYYQYHFEGFGNKGVPIISFGGITELSEVIQIGAFVENLTQAKISELQDERVPTIMQAGIAYKPFDGLSINADIRKDIEFDTSLLIGLSYDIIERFTLRTGFNTNPARQFFGVDFAPHNIKSKLSYALAHQESLGFAHQVSIQYDFKRSE